MGCIPGLVCTDRKCRRPCQPQEPRSCPDGYFCGTADVEGPTCLPSCEGRSCPEGQRCVALDHGMSVCARVHGMDCQLNPCSAEQVCDVSLSSRESQVDALMKCALTCNEQGASCPDGFSCIEGRCRQRCRSESSDSCGPLEKCVGASERYLGFCVFDTDK
jgi:hypothetical protein